MSTAPSDGVSRNYRLCSCHMPLPFGTLWGIREVHYFPDGTVKGTRSVTFDRYSSPARFEEMLARMREALDQPVLPIETYDDLPVEFGPSGRPYKKSGA
jgi:hypothetical protein